MFEKILDITNSFPTSFGVYIMKDQDDKPIYIGKAKNLKSRVRSYFSKDKSDRHQIPYMVNEAVSVDYLITKTESEALLVENSLIKRHKPKYNIRLKDDKTYSSLRLSINEKYPRLTFTRRVREDGALYFGPFASGETLKQTSRLVQKLFPVRDCSDEKFKRHKHRPCLSYFIKLCSGPCADKISEEKYKELVDQAAIFLRGERKELIKIIKDSMKNASEQTRYEDAAYYRDQLKYIKKNVEVEKLISSSLLDKDVIGFYEENDSFEFTVLFSRDGAIVDKADFSVKGFNLKSEDVLREFLGRFYYSDRYIPSEILVQRDIYDSAVYSKWLTETRRKKAVIITPKRGEKLKLIQMAVNNAKESFLRKQNERKRGNLLLEG
ncbi:MAG: excinuclease ABC subunit UvrC, partial [Thermodesulfobacteriota bacterium]